MGARDDKQAKPPAWGAYVAALLVALLGLALAGGGVWLIMLGGSWAYAVIGAALLATALLLALRHPAALWLYAATVLGALVWALWEVGLDWWALAARGGLLFVVGLLLLLPPVLKPLRGDSGVRRRPGWPLAGALAAAFVVAAVSWFMDPHAIRGRAGPVEGAGVSAPAEAPDGEWPAYGRTQAGQRYSPLDQITPQNVGQIEKAWEYHTGDVPGSQPGDPGETTFEVTPLKIDDTLYLCTPHQHVIALDADTGEEVWRVDVGLPENMALQHLTCRGLAYHPPSGAAGADRTGGQGDAAATQAPMIPDLQALSREALAAPAAGAQTAQAGGCDAKLFMPTADGRLIALDPETGDRCAGFGNAEGELDLWQHMPNVKPGSYYSTSPPVVSEDVVVIGGTVLDHVSTQEASGVIRAFDVDTGELVWNWDPGRPERTEPIGEGETYTANSPNAWSIFSYDKELGLVYVPMGNAPPDQWGGNRTEAMEKYASSVVALDVRTGEVAWHFQTVHHDLWDYDVPAQPSLVDLRIDGETVPALAQPTKQGGIFVLNRKTGEPIVPVRENPVPQGAAEGDYTAETQPVSDLTFKPPKLTGKDMWGLTPIDQMYCRIKFQQLRYEGRYTPPSTQGTLVHPGLFGVFNWGSVAIDPKRQIAFGTPAYLAFVVELVPRPNPDALVVHEEQPKHNLPPIGENFGAPFAVRLKPFTSPIGRIPCQQPPWGYVAAASLTSGETIYRHKNGTVRDLAPLPLPFEMGVPDLGGPIVTAGGVAFLTGTVDYYLRAYDTETGEMLTRRRLPAGGQATPMTYKGEDGRQYVLAIAGGHGSLNTETGDAVIAYALPKQAVQ